MREIPHSIATIESQHGLNEGNVGEVVKGVVVVLGNAVDYFLAGVHRLYIDACFSSDGWNILVACFLDANHRIQPVGFRLGQSESYVDWYMFLRQLYEAGLHAASDLVIYSDRNEAIRSAVERVFPECEHTPCSVHIERNIQDKWNHVYPPLRKDNELGITVLNAMIECYNNACIAIDEEECGDWLERMKTCEVMYSGDDDSHPMWDYIVEIDGTRMCKWKFNHLMERTSNPIESCMSALCRDLNGLGKTRAGSFFNRYRMVLCWSLMCMKKRVNWMTYGKGCIPLNASCVLYCPWVLSTIVKRGHYVECYSSELVVEVGHRSDGTRTISWNGKEAGRKKKAGRYYFRVIDKPHKLVFMVNLLNKDNPCSCHRSHWEKTPCIHIIRVLHSREEYWRVWEFVGKEYSLTEAKKTTGELNEKEMGLLKDLLTQKSIESESSFIWRNASKGNGQNKKRFKSRGEYNEPAKKSKK